MEALARMLNIRDREGWYSVNSSTLRQYGASSLLHKYNGSISKLLATVYPEYHATVRKLNIPDISGMCKNLVTCRVGIGGNKVIRKNF